jgi:hypothetical protein
MLQWGDGMPSQSCKETLIKYVAQAIATYIMGVFILPMAVCDDLAHMVRNYWWGLKQGRRKTHWISWITLHNPNHMVAWVSGISGFSTRPF